MRQAIKEVLVIEITQEYCESLVSSMPRRILAVTDSKGEHTKYLNVVTLTLLDAIKFPIALYYIFGEINLYNLESKQKIKINHSLVNFIKKVMSGLKLFQVTVY